MSEVKFLNGLRVYAPRENAPDFVKGQIVINARELVEALGILGQETVRLDIKQSKAGNYYASINEYKPTTKTNSKATEEAFEDEFIIPGEEF